MEQEKECYHAYLLRLWQVKDQGQLVWRVSLDNAHTGERHGFGCLDELFAYLQRLAGELPAASDIADEGDD